jgi:hypothetical protein
MEKALKLLLMDRHELGNTKIVTTEMFNEAIAELQEAMKPKTCEGCNHLFFDEIEEVYKCINDVSDDVGYLHGEAVIRNIKDFYCAQYRSKDNA